MDMNLLVRIFVPSPTGSGKGKIATGYPVAKNRILTARHVLSPIIEGRGEDSTIELRWYHQETEAGNCKTININKIVWEGGEKCDAALIYCDFPEGCEAWGVLSEEKPNPNTRWESAGFAKAGKKDDFSRPPVGLQGNVYRMADTESAFELGVDDHTELPDGWRGVSGSPVFVNNKIIGVIVFCPPNFEAKRLRATPVWKLLQIPEFRQAIDYDDRVKRLDRVRQKVTRALQQSTAAMEVLGEELNLERSPDPKQWAKVLTDKLLNLGVEPLIQKAKKAHRMLLDQDKQKDAEAIRTVIHWVIPAVFDDGVVQAIYTRKSEPWAALVPFPVTTKTVAEIIMAGVDRRRALFRSLAQGDVFPEGELSLPMPPESGLDDNSERFMQAWHTYLIDKFAKNSRTRFKQEVLIKHVSMILTQFAEDGRSHYFICFTSAGPDRQQWELVIRELKALYPAVVFIELSADEKLFLQETKMFGPLCDLLVRPPGETP